MIRRGIGVQSFVSAGVPTDADAQAFITAAGITDATQQSAINTLVTDLKGYGIWIKMKAIYPFVGGTSSSHKWNLKDPRDLDAAFRLVFTGGITHNSNGITGNGTNGYCDTKLNENNILTLNNEHISVYSRTNNAANMCDIGLQNSGNTSTQSNLFAKFSDNNFYPRINASNNGTANTGTSTGLFISNRVSSTQIRAFINNNSFIISNNSVGKLNGNFFIGALNDTVGLPTFYSNRNYAFASIGDGLTDTEAANLYTAVQAYQTSLSRNI